MIGVYDEPTLLPRADMRWAVAYRDVVLEPLCREHLTAAAKSCTDAHAKKMLRHAFPWIDQSAAAVADELGRRLLGPWAYRASAFATTVGGEVVGLRYVERTFSLKHERSATTGGWVHRRMRGQGVGSAALYAAVRYAAAERGFAVMATGTRRDNEAAQANLRSCGFVPDPEKDAADAARRPGRLLLSNWVRFAPPEELDERCLRREQREWSDRSLFPPSLPPKARGRAVEVGAQMSLPLA